MRARRDKRNHDPDYHAPRARRSSGGFFRWRTIFLLLFIAALVMAWFAPNVLINSPLRDSLVRSQLGTYPGKVTFGSASAGWLSGIEARDVSIVDDKGDVILSVAAARTEKTLLTLVSNHKNLGVIRVEKPKLVAKVRDDGSNIEDFLNAILTESSSSHEPIGVIIDVVDAEATVTHVPSNATWTLSNLISNIAIPTDSSPITATMKGIVTNPRGATGSLASEVKWTLAQAPSSGIGVGEVKLATASLPIDLVTVITRRLGVELSTDGKLDAQAIVQHDATGWNLHLTNLQTADLVVDYPAALSSDQLRLRTLTAKGMISVRESDLVFQACEIQSDAGNGTITGTVQFPSSTGVTNTWLASLRRSNIESTGTLDVARLLATLPNTLRLRPDAQIDAGQIRWTVAGTQDRSGNVWQGDVVAENLRGVVSGQQVEWKEPVSCVVRVRDEQERTTIERLTCQSDFLNVEGRGTLLDGNLTARMDLSRFAEVAGRFFDLSTFQSAGAMTVDATWRLNNNQLALQANATAKDFQLTYAGGRPWQESDLKIQIDGVAGMNGNSIAEISSGNVNLVAQKDQLNAQLTQPASWKGEDTALAMNVEFIGDVKRWTDRMQMFFSMGEWELRGDGTLKGDVLASMKEIRFQDAKGVFQNAVIRGGGLTIQEPTLNLEATGSVAIPSGAVVLSRGVGQGASIAFTANDVMVQPTAAGYAVQGDVHYRANLERVTKWWVDPASPPDYRVQGEAAGRATVKYANGVSQADLVADVTNFSADTRSAPATAAVAANATNWKQVWSEPRLRVVGHGSLDLPNDRLVLDRFEVAGASLQLATQGSIAAPFAQCDVALTGQYAYDLNPVSLALQQKLGPGFRVTGQSSRPFNVRGPLLSLANVSSPAVRPVSSSSAAASTSKLDWRSLLAEAGVSWDTLEYQGFAFGKGAIDMQMQNGLVVIQPISIPVNDGTMQLSPRLDLNREPAMVTIEPGTVISNVAITPEMCRSWLQLVAPLVAGATEATGRFSLGVSEAQFPANDPAAGRLQANLIVHSAQVGPGPLAQQLVALAQQVRSIAIGRPLSIEEQRSMSWLEIPEQQLGFHLADRRVHHRDLQFHVKDVAIRTQGWVGLDQQLAMMAEIPIRDEWLGTGKLAAGLKGQTIKVPVTGTLSRPQLDASAMRELTRQTVTGAASNLLQDQINRGLDRLFQPKPNNNPAAPKP